MQLKRIAVGLSVSALLVGSLVSLVGVSASTAASKAKEKAKAPYKVAIITDESGPGLLPGAAPLAAGAAAYFKMINKTGGVKGHQVKYTITDSQSSPTVAAAAVQGAISSHALAIIDGDSGSELTAMQSALGSAPIPLLTYGLADSSLYPTPVSNEYMFAPSALQQAQATYNKVKSLLGGSMTGKTIAFVGLDVPYITGMESDLATIAAKGGASIDTVQLYPFGTTSFTAQASIVAADNPSAIIQADIPTGTVIAVTALEAAGVTKAPIVAFSSGSGTQTFQSINAPNYYALRYSAYPSVGTAIYKAVKAEGFVKYTTDANLSVGWAMAAAVAKALGQCAKTCSANRVNAAMSTVPSFTPPDGAYYGPLTFSTTNHADVTAGQFYTYTDGKVVASGKPTKFS